MGPAPSAPGAVREHDAALYSGWCGPVHCWRQRWISDPCLVRTTLRAPDDARVRPQGSVLLVASLPVDCVCAAGPVLVLAAGRLSQLLFLLFVVGLSLAPSLVAPVPVVPRNAHGSALAGKSYTDIS